MKKKKILLGLALAAAAVFSLASCGDDTKPADNGGSQVTPDNGGSQGGNNSQGGNQGTGGNTQATKYTVTFNSNQGSSVDSQEITSGGKVSKPTNPTRDEYTFVGWFKDENLTQEFNFDTDTITAATTLYAKWSLAHPEKVTITYVTNEGTAINAAEIDYGTKLTNVGTTTRLNYGFDGWYTNEALTDKFDADQDIISDTTLYAKWYAASYESIKAKGGCYKQSFDNISSLREYSYVSAFDVYPGVYYLSVPHGDKPNSPKSNYRYEITEGKLVLIDEEQSDTKGSVKGIVNFGNTTDYEILEGYVDVTIPTHKNSWTFFQLYGTDSAKNNNEIFGLRSDSDKIVYRLDGIQKTEDILNQFSLSNGISFGIHIVINQKTGKISIDLVKRGQEGDEVIPFVKDLTIDGYVLANRFLFTSVDGGTQSVTIDNILLRGEGTTDDLESFKAKSLAYVEPFFAEIAPRYITNRDAFDAAVNALQTAINNAEDKATIEAILDFNNPSPEVLAIEAVKSENQIAVDEIMTAYPQSNYTINAIEYNTALMKLSTATGTEAINAAKEAFANIQNDAAAKADYIAAKVSDFQKTYPASNYTFKDNDYNNKTDYDDLVASITGNNKNEIDLAYYNAIVMIPTIPTNEALLDGAKTTYKTNAENYRTDLSGKTLDSSEEAAVAAYYTGDTFTTKLATVKNALDAETVTTITAIKSAYDSFTASVDTDVNALVMSIDELKADRIAQITNVDLPAAKEGQSADVQALLDAAATNATKSNGTIMTATSKDEVKAKYQKCIDEFALIIYKDQKKTAFKTWITETYGSGAEKEIKTTNTTALADLQDAEDDVMVLIDLAESKDDVDAEFVDGKTLYESKYQALLQYEFTVTYANTTITSGNVVYGNAITKPTDPEVDANHLFVGWYADALFETAFDFTELRYDDVTLYAKIVDAVTVTLNYNAKINNVTTKAIKIEKNGKLSTDDLNVTQSGAKLVGWYDSDDFTTTKYDENTEINSSVQLYAKWHDVYKSKVTSTIQFTSTNCTSEQSPLTIKDSLNIVEFYSKSDVWDSSKSGIKLNGETKSGTRYIKVVASGACTIKLIVSTGGSARNFKLEETLGKYSGDKPDATVAKNSSNVTVTINVTSEGTYYINTSGGGVYINKIDIETTAPTEIKEIKASIANEANKISVSNVKLIDIDDNEIAITEGYNVSVVNSANQEVENWQDALPAGNYRVYVQYGSYTQIVGPVPINGMA